MDGIFNAAVTRPLVAACTWMPYADGAINPTAVVELVLDKVALSHTHGEGIPEVFAPEINNACEELIGKDPNPPWRQLCLQGVEKAALHEAVDDSY
jgi:hypothetical protein